MTFDVLLLVCILGQDPSECVPQTARAVEKIGEGTSELDCMRWGALSSGGSVVKPQQGEYAKIECVRRG
jgi:hypothetical protein